MIRVYIDSCAWNVLSLQNMDLREQLPPDSFEVFITPELSFEIDAICPAKGDLKHYILEQIQKRGISVDRLFGFDAPETPREKHRYGGFDNGRWLGSEGCSFINRERGRESAALRKKTGLLKNEADLALAARSFDGVVLTNESRAKSGPLRRAFEKGGQIVHIESISDGTSLRNAITNAGLAVRQRCERCRE